MAEPLRFSAAALIPSMRMLTALAPMASIGWRTVVSEGTKSCDGFTSSKPMIEHSCGTLMPALARAAS